MNVSAIILAAGRSSRMGRPKQLIQIEGRTLLERTIDAVKNSRCNEIILVLGHHANDIQNAIPLPGNIKTVINESYEEGMSSSIRRGLRSVSDDSSAALIVLADQPFLSSNVIDRLISEKKNSDALILFPVYNGFRGNPVLVDRSLFKDMVQLTGDIGCRSLFGLYPEKMNKVSVDDPGILIDIDTDEDLKNIKVENGRVIIPAATAQDEDRFIGKQLILIGRSDVAENLENLAKLMKFRVIAVDPLISKATSQADRILQELDLSKAGVTSSSSIVIASRGKFDEEALEQAVQTDASYIGLLGSRKRGAELLQQLQAKGVDAGRLKRVKYPAGLEIHAKTPEEIALSVMAEVIAQYNRMNYVE